MSDDLKETFFVECFELLDVLSAGLRDFSAGAVEDFEATISPMFRAAHSIKGAAGAFGFDEMSRFAYRLETTLKAARDKKVELTPEVMEVLFRASDALADRVRADKEGAEPDLERETATYADLGELIGADDDAAGGEEDVVALDGFQPMGLDLDLPGGDAPIGEIPGGEIPGGAAPLSLDLDLVLADEAPAATGPFRIRLAARADLYRRGSDITKLLRALKTVGALETTCDAAGAPRFDALDPEAPALAWLISVEDGADEEEVREVFEFFEDDIELEITRDAAI